MKIEKYSEDLLEYAGLIHEACEGRYEITLYDLNVIESALIELIEYKNSNNKLLNEFVSWHNNNYQNNYIPNSRIGIYLKNSNELE